MVVCLKFSKGKQKEFLLIVKRKLNCSWDKIAEAIKVHRQLIFVYLNETSKISKKNFDSLCRISKLDQQNFKFKEIEIINKEQKIKYPKLSRNLSEFIGHLAGDGYISYQKPHEVCIVSHRILDKDLIEVYCYNLIRDLFGIKPKIIYQKNTVKIRVYSKNLKKFLIQKYKLPKGKKKGKLKIPKQIKQNKGYLKSYLRGLFDTDGSFHRHHKKTGCIEFISRDKFFLKEIANSLKNLKFRISSSGKSLYIYDKGNIKRFFDEIGSKNLKNIIKYQKFVKEGIVPSNKEIIHFMRQ